MDDFRLREQAREGDDIQSTETRGFYTGEIEPQDTCEAIQVQYNRQTQESIIDVDVVEWEQAEMAKHGGVVVVCTHNRNLDLTMAHNTLKSGYSRTLSSHFLLTNFSSLRMCAFNSRSI
jgi:xanthine/CO dehydrogenase XdhC/CoxF family maturation factor